METNLIKNRQALTHKLFAGVAVLTVSLSATIAVAAPKHQITTQGPNGASKIAKVNTGQSQVSRPLSPFNLAYMAYQGWFTDNGVPAANRLVQGYRGGRITAKDVAQAAVQSNRLSAETLDDTRYLSSLNNQLRALSQPD